MGIEMDKDALRSTELFDSSVRSRARLPEPLQDLRGTTLDNRVLIFGENFLTFY